MATELPALLQSFFTDRLLRQRQASPHTIAGYRDCFRLLLYFAKERLGKMPSQLLMEDLDAPFVGLFLEHLQSVRKNSARTRNARLGAIHSFFRYVALEEPALALHCQRILAVPNKRHERRPIEFLNREEIDALLAVRNLSTWLGRRDRTLLLVAVQTGLRVSELIGLNCQDVVLGPVPTCAAWAKGENNVAHRSARKRQGCWMSGYANAKVYPKIRSFPASVAVDSAGMRSSVSSLSTPIVPNQPARRSNGRSVSTCTSPRRSHGPSSPCCRSLRDRPVIALWLGHELVETTQMYLHADMRLKEKALLRTTPLGVKAARFRPDDKLLAFLEAL